MKITQITLLALVCGAAPLALGAGLDIGINIGGPEVVVHSQPPPERIETIPVAPGPGYVWIRGHWLWHRERWEWKAGYFERASQPGSMWVSGKWVARGNGWVWVEGHFDVPAPAPSYYNSTPGGEVVANETPPAEIVETIPVAPGPDYFWIGGRWSWNGRWTWVHGHYERHPHFHPGAGWEAGRWDRKGNGWVWHEGHWR
jgi:hypothetical protein